MRFNTPLRYPGGKGKLTDFIKLVFEQNNLLGGQYVEPYAGGAGIALNLLLQDYASYIHLNDLNISVYAFWHSVLNHPNELCKAIWDVKVTMKEWHRQREIQNGDPNHHDLLELGFSTFFLNRTNRSGIIKGGVIGGKNQDGPWKIDARFNRENLCKRIEKIAQHHSRINIYNMDAAIFITDIIPSLPRETLIYLDPPYYVKGQGLYQNHYMHEGHVKISELVKKHIKHPWIVSYDHTVEIVDMYKGCPMITYGINYSAQDRYKGAEIMFFNKKLVIPDIKNPANLKVV